MADDSQQGQTIRIWASLPRRAATGVVLLGFVLMAATEVTFAQPPTDLRENIRASSPAELLQMWEEVGRNERRLISERLFETKSVSLPVLRETVLTGTYRQKQLALDFLEETRDRDSLQTLLLVAENDSSDLIRTRAVIVLREIGERSAVPALRAILRATDDPRVVQAILFALGKLGSQEDLWEIRAWLASDHPGIKLQASSALAQLGSPEGAAVILEASLAEDPLTSKRATEALGYLDTDAARARLSSIVDSETARWKSHARVSLARHELRRLDSAEQLDYLTGLTGGADRQVARWAVDQIADHPSGTEVLQLLAASSSEAGRRAASLIKARGVG